jgi:ubiquinol-cytochrome c reductase cytochrome b subunit
LSKIHADADESAPASGGETTNDDTNRLTGLRAWIDARTGYRVLMHEALEEPIPGGARWRYVFGSALTAAFMIQLATGLLLMTSYSPSASTAWGSVYFISSQMDLGWLIRGIHHFGSQAMVILLVLHVLQVVLAGAYRAPREFNWWLGLALAFLTLGFSLTGYLLPWDQKGFWATKVATKIAGTSPGLGPQIEKIIVGGTEYGNQTLTRFYGLHVGILPTLFAVCLVLHLFLFRKHGVTAPASTRPPDTFWPKQFFMDTAASFVVLAVLLGLVFWEGGANLDAPADPSSLDYPARPEWYFLSLFQLLKKFPGKYELIGTMVVPAVIVTVMFLLPLLDKIFPRKLAHFFACSFVFALLGGAAYLTVDALRADAKDKKFQETRELANRDRLRALRLADVNGVPPDGAVYLLQRDPATRGKALLVQKCLGCHSFDGQGKKEVGDEIRGADLTRYASYEWIREFLKNPSAPPYAMTAKPTSSDAAAGKRATKQRGMSTWKTGSALDEGQIARVARFVASFAEIPADLSFEEWSRNPRIQRNPGYAPFVEECLTCHTVGNWGEEGKTMKAPNLFAYGSPAWLARMIRRPDSPLNYSHLGSRQAMPSFDEGQLSESELTTLTRYLLDDYLGIQPRPRQGQGGALRPASTE